MSQWSTQTSVAPPASKRVRFVLAKKKPRKRAGRSDLVSIPKGMPFPRRYRCTLVYEENQQVTMTASVMTPYVYSLNGLYDPNITSTGHQPMYFDQLMSIYNHYQVIAAKVTFQPLSASVNQLSWCIVEADSASTTNSAYDGERPGAQVLSGMGAYLSGQKLFLTYSARKTFGPGAIGDADLIGTASANPSEQSYLHIQCSAMSGLSVSETLYFRVHIEYYTEFSEIVTTIANS